MDRFYQTTQFAFFESAEKWADKPRFMVRSKDVWSPILWREYREKVELITCALRSLGIGIDDKIGIYSDNLLEWIYAGIASMTAHGVLVPIYHATTVEQGSHIIKDADIRLLFIQNLDLLNHLFSGGSEFPLLKYLVIFEGEAPDEYKGRKCFSLPDFYDAGDDFHQSNPDLLDELVDNVEDNMTAQMLYTSGTTGNPKGVPLTYGNLIASTNDWLEINGPLVIPESIDLHWLPNSHIYGWGSIGLGNILSFTSYLTNPNEVLQLMPELHPHLFMSVPLYYEKLFQSAMVSAESEEERIEALKKLTGGRLSFLLSGGAGLKKSIKEFFLKAGMWITEGYGLTECSPTLTMNRHDDYDFDSVGKPFPSVELKLAEDGEILARGPVVFGGYYKDPEATAQAFTDDGWLKTGDIGKWLEGGFLKITDRKKDIIVTAGGKNVSPTNIENLFVEDSFIEHAVVYGDGKKFVSVLLTLREPQILDYLHGIGIELSEWKKVVELEEIANLAQSRIDVVNEKLAPYEMIRKFVISHEHLTPLNGLLTPSLKLKRRETYERFGAMFERLYEN